MPLLPPIHPVEDVAWRSDYLLTLQDRTELDDLYVQCMLCSDEAQLGDLETRLSRLKSALASYKKLPLEILSSIFSLSRSPSVYWIPGGVEHDFSCYPEHVCSLWRQIALSTPTLYETVSIDYSDYESDTPGGLLTLNEMTIYACKIVSRGARKLFIEFSRLESAPSQDVLRQLLTPGPRLEKLILRHSNSDTGIVNRTLSLLASMPSTLKHLTIDFCNANDIRYTPEFLTSSHFASDTPWKTLQYLSLSGTVLALSPATVQLLFSKCPQLRTCKLRLSGSEPSPESSIHLTTPNILLDKLKHLELALLAGWWPHPDQFGSLLSSFTLPSLERVIITGRTKTLVKAKDLCDLFDRSRCKLKQFQFFISSLSEQDLQFLLRSKSFSTLKKFYLTTSPIYPSVLREIASGELLPRLTYLKGVIRPNAESVEALYHAARARKGAQAEGVTELKILDFLCGIYDNVLPDPPLPSIPPDLAEMYDLAGGWFRFECLFPHDEAI